MPFIEKIKKTKVFVFVVAFLAVVTAVTQLAKNIEYLTELFGLDEASDSVDYAFEDILIGIKQDAPVLLRTGILVNNRGERPVFAIEAYLDIEGIVGDKAVGKNTKCHFNTNTPSVGQEIKAKSREIIFCDINLYWMTHSEVEVLRDKICAFHIRSHDLERGDQYYEVQSDLC